MIVSLKAYEVYIAAMVGARRTISSLGSSKTGNVNADVGWHTDIEGAGGEMAVAKALDVYWDGSVDTYKLPDVGKYQVRQTELSNGSLIVREGDSDDEIFILVTGKAPLYEVRGYMLGAAAKREEFVRDPHGMSPAWFVPQGKLSPIEDLIGASE